MYDSYVYSYSDMVSLANTAYHGTLCMPRQCKHDRGPIKDSHSSLVSLYILSHTKLLHLTWCSRHRNYRQRIKCISVEL